MPLKHETLSGIALFAGLSENEIQALAQRAVERRFAADEMLFWEGDPCTGIFLLTQGSAKIFKTSAAGRARLWGAGARRTNCCWGRATRAPAFSCCPRAAQKSSNPPRPAAR